MLVVIPTSALQLTNSLDAYRRTRGPRESIIRGLGRRAIIMGISRARACEGGVRRPVEPFARLEPRVTTVSVSRSCSCGLMVCRSVSGVGSAVGMVRERWVWMASAIWASWRGVQLAAAASEWPWHGKQASGSRPPPSSTTSRPTQWHASRRPRSSLRARCSSAAPSSDTRRAQKSSTAVR